MFEQALVNQWPRIAELTQDKAGTLSGMPEVRVLNDFFVLFFVAGFDDAEASAFDPFMKWCSR
jgi:hypothetical protein